MRHLLLFAIVEVVLVLSFIFWRLGKVDKSIPISANIARNKFSSTLFGISLTLSMVLMLLYGYGWLIPAYGLGIFFAVLYGVILINLLILGWVPLSEGRRGTVHNVAAYGMAWLFIPVVAILAITSGWVAVRILGLLFVLFAFSLVGLYFFSRSARRNFFLWQSTYFISFLVFLLTATYIH